MNKIRSVGIIGAIVAGAMLSSVGASAASAQPIAMTTTSTATVVGASVNVGAVKGRLSPSGGVVAPAQGGASTDGIPIKPIIDWVKNNASSIIPAMKSALKSGLNAFKKWWNGLASWIRAGITALGQMSVQELFSQLWNYFFG
ncbi:hypothetical protein [Curtobacterium sp. ZW137]|uniref:hypothetical protein n=1 Tax=Curtobacterium sp. ZW137 TaxID=2485104 RepID=UPI000F4CDA00|nr:hypothetical protein [Curtobacterium sp. ZW137]ROP63239.1 hypothetical protein EDF55_1993 [Curtobacterium sp. ZW137]